MLTLGSLFDGIGGFPLAAVNNGIVPLWASEIEPFPIAVTSKHFPQMLHLGDITKLNGAELPPVDNSRGLPVPRLCRGNSYSEVIAESSVLQGVICKNFGIT